MNEMTREPATKRADHSTRSQAGDVIAQASVPERGLELAVQLAAGATSVIVGPNGAGKSSLLQLISGQLRPTSGTVTIDDVPVAASEVWVPPHRRQVAVLTQNALLFPHLSVLENVAYGPRAAGQSKAAARERALHELEQVDAVQFAGRRPAQLSGGQAQRIAIARALACDPKVLLLDEPFAAIDVEQTAILRALLAKRLAGRTTILVSHDLYDIATLGDQLVVIEDGQVAAAGKPDELLANPASAFLAKLAGVNRLVGVIDGPDSIRVGELQVVGLSEQGGEIGDGESGSKLQLGGTAIALFDPSAVALYAEQSSGSPRNVWAVQVVNMQRIGAIVRLSLQLPDGQQFAADLTPQSSAALVEPGARLYASVKAVQIRLLPVLGAVNKLSG